MTTKKSTIRPRPKTASKDDAKAHRFIRGGGNAKTEKLSAEGTTNGTGTVRKPVMMKIPEITLIEIDAAAGNLHLDRTAFMMTCVRQQMALLEKSPELRESFERIAVDTWVRMR